jgi:hypothetical protein
MEIGYISLKLTVGSQAENSPSSNLCYPDIILNILQDIFSCNVGSKTNNMKNDLMLLIL